MPFDPAEYPTMSIEVHFCQACGDHGREEVQEWGGKTRLLYSYDGDEFCLRKCDTCGLLACESCISERDCCDRRADFENEGRPKAGQQEMFT